MDCDCLFQKFINILSENDKKLILSGARYQFIDKGEFFNALRRENCGVKSCSSHISIANQYRCSQRNNLNILYSKSEKGTWVQIEEWSPYTHPVCHFFSFLYFKLTGRQTGSNGTSSRNENEPVIVCECSWIEIKRKLKTQLAILGV